MSKKYQEQLNSLIAMVIEAEGGDRYHSNRGEKTATKYGIYGHANGLTNEQVKALTYEQAVAIYKEKYVTADVLEALKQHNCLEAAMVFNMNVNLGLGGKQKVVAMSAQSKESLGESLLRYYKMLKNAELYYHGWAIRVARNYEMAEKLRQVSS